MPNEQWLITDNRTTNFIKLRKSCVSSHLRKEMIVSVLNQLFVMRLK